MKMTKIQILSDEGILDLKKSQLCNHSLASLIATLPVNKVRSINLSANSEITQLPQGIKFSALEILNLSNCFRCTTTTVVSIAVNCRGLNTLILAGCGISSLPCDIGDFLNILELLNLRGNKLISLPLSMIHLKHLIELNISNNRLSDSSMDILRNILGASASQLTSLYLANNRIGAAGAMALAESLVCGSVLGTLVLTGNINIGDNGAVAIFNAIVTASCRHLVLHTLRLDACNITDQIGRTLAAAIRANVTLRTLNLGRNRLGNEAVVSLSRALEDQRGSSGITELDLSENQLQANGAVAIAAAVLHNDALLRLNLAGNDNLLATSRATIALADGVARNNVFPSLLLVHVFITHIIYRHFLNLTFLDVKLVVTKRGNFWLSLNQMNSLIRFDLDLTALKKPHLSKQSKGGLGQ